MEIVEKNIKQFTESGKKISHYTMRVFFKPEFFRYNQKTGEQITCWTYRSDVEFDNLVNSGITCGKPIDALGWLFKTWQFKYVKAEIFDNTKPFGQNRLMLYECDKMRFPQGERLTKFWNWINSL